MPAQPAHLWSTRGTQAPSTGMPVPRCQGVACMFLTVRLAAAAVGSSMPMASSTCTPAPSPLLHGQRLRPMP
jgi:hypothetical protein